MGRYEEAIAEDEKSQLLGGASPEEAAAEAATKLQAFKTGGERGYWRHNLDLTLRALKAPNGVFVSASDLASSYALAGEKDKAFQWLDKAYAERDGEDITLLNCDPVFKNLHGDPRFADLLRRLGLPA
jgi:hypothetical protein